ncbi:MAG TPA: CPBP family intramembrane glutamic endopeptidase [Gemmataceae bacterium]|nr:CPBP family intramembrane glutamic endopeptidase [Gemmataceae bacterium]
MRREWSALIFAMSFPAATAWFYFVALARPQLVDSPATTKPPGNAWVQATYAAGKVIQFAFPVLFLALAEPSSLRPGRPHFRGLIWGIAFGLLVGAGVFILYWAGLRTWLMEIGTTKRIQSKIEEFNCATPIRYVALAGFLAVIHSLMEEYYWRWFVFGRLRRLLALSSAITLSSFAFMAHHVIVLGMFFPNHFWTAAVPFSLCIAVGGAFWAWLYHRTGSIYSPWISHLLVDLAILAIGYDLVFGTW